MKKTPRKKTYGSQSTTGGLVDRIRGSIAVAVAEQVLLILAGLLLPQFALAIYAGYYVYKYGQKALTLKKDYDEIEGEPAQKATVLALREGFEVGIGMAVGKPAGELISKSVHTTTQELSRNGTFEKVADAAGFPTQANLLRDFYTSTTERVGRAIYDGTQDAITGYIARREINS